MNKEKSQKYCVEYIPVSGKYIMDYLYTVKQIYVEYFYASEWDHKKLKKIWLYLGRSI